MTMPVIPTAPATAGRAGAARSGGAPVAVGGADFPAALAAAVETATTTGQQPEGGQTDGQDQRDDQLPANGVVVPPADAAMALAVAAVGAAPITGTPPPTVLTSQQVAVPGAGTATGPARLTAAAVAGPALAEAAPGGTPAAGPQPPAGRPTPAADGALATVAASPSAATGTLTAAGTPTVAAAGTPGVAAEGTNRGPATTVAAPAPATGQAGAATGAGQQVAPTAQAAGGGTALTAPTSAAAEAAPTAVTATAGAPAPVETPAPVVAAPAAAGLAAPAGPAPRAAPVPVAPAPPAAPATPAQQMATHIVPLKLDADGVHRLTVHLHPADLGAVSVVAEVRDGAIAVQITGATEAGREALRASLPDLRRELAQAGFQDTALDLRQDAGPGQQRHQSAMPGARGGNGATLPEPEPLPAPTAMPAGRQLDLQL
ncbi:flagellar hook-length control protein FliK [Pilimelia columellifera]|uniref:Flagellar hook-length control protein-like C-terminal domain-containing protein n=1 Tax=Pilimelia columellifera subsp. columellifera TaxID=706583 RepID=A0ABN3N7X0_9ACTN